MPSYLTSDLLTTIKTKALIPTNQVTFTDTNLLTIANEELQSAIVPMIMAVREEYFVTYKDTTIADNTGVAVPARAIGAILRDITIVNGTQEFSIPLVPAEEAPEMSATFYPSGGPVAAFLRGNKVFLAPPTGTTGSLRLYYFERPNNLVLTTAVGRIDGINLLTNTITLNQVPTAFTLTTSFDFIMAQPTFDLLAKDQIPTQVSGVNFTFASLPSNMVVGDYLCLAGESIVPQIPVEYHPVLAQRVVVRVLEALGDVNGTSIAKAKLQELEKYAQDLISPRVQGEAKKISNKRGVLNKGRFSRYFR
jgi:hypothetical protein